MNAIKELIDMMCTYDKDPNGLAQQAKEEFAVLDTLISQLPTVPSEMKWKLVSSTPLTDVVIMTEEFKKCDDSEIRVDSQMGDIYPPKIKGVVDLKGFKPKHPYFGGRTTDDVNADEPKSLEGVDDVTVEWQHFPFSKPTLDVHSDETPKGKLVSTPADKRRNKFKRIKEMERHSEELYRKSLTLSKSIPSSPSLSKRTTTSPERIFHGETPQTPIDRMISALTLLKDNPGTIFSISTWFKGCKLYIDGKVVSEDDKNFLFTFVYDGEQPLLVGLEDLWGRTVSE